jgi:hypothetical protein
LSQVFDIAVVDAVVRTPRKAGDPWEVGNSERADLYEVIHLGSRGKTAVESNGNDIHLDLERSGRFLESYQEQSPPLEDREWEAWMTEMSQSEIRGPFSHQYFEILGFDAYPDVTGLPVPD